MANAFMTFKFVILKMIVEIIVMNQDHMVLYVVCCIMFFAVTNFYERSQLAELGFQILTSMESCHPLNLLITKHSCLKCLWQLLVKQVILKEQSLISLKFSKALVSSIEEHQLESRVTFLIALLR